MPQKAIITFTDGPGETVKVSLTFDPPIKGDARMTGAIHLAMQAMQVINSTDVDDDE